LTFPWKSWICDGGPLLEIFWMETPSWAKLTKSLFHMSHFRCPIPPGCTWNSSIPHSTSWRERMSCRALSVRCTQVDRVLLLFDFNTMTPDQAVFVSLRSSQLIHKSRGFYGLQSDRVRRAKKKKKKKA
jgi:hypothetical protein